MKNVSFTLIGATGVVGQELLSLLVDDQLKNVDLQICASDDSVGEYYDFNGKEVELLAYDKLDFSGPTLTVLACPKDVSTKILPEVTAKSLAVIDTSGLDWRSHELKFLPSAISAERRQQAFTVRSAAGLMIANVCKALVPTGNIEQLSATCIESVSGAGRGGLDELWNQTRSIFNQAEVESEYFPEQIAFNVLSVVDVLGEDGISLFERRVIAELGEFGIHQTAVHVTAIRVPIMYGSGVSLSLTLAQPITEDEVQSRLSAVSNFILHDIDSSPSTLAALGDDKIHIGRVRISKEDPRKLSLWLAIDNIRAAIARPILDAFQTLLPLT